MTTASKMEWARQSCRAWGGRLPRKSPLPGQRRPHPRPLSASGEGRTAAVPYCARSAVRLSPPGTGGVARRRRDGVGPSPFHRFRVPEPGMTTASKIPAAGLTATSPPAPLHAWRGENGSSSLLRENRRLPLPSHTRLRRVNGRGGPPQAGRGRAVFIVPPRKPPFARLTATSPPAPLHSWRGRTAAVPCCAGIAVCLSPPIPACGGSTGGVARRRRDGVGPFSSFQSAGTRHDDCGQSPSISAPGISLPSRAAQPA
jgi:hypothetical protein